MLVDYNGDWDHVAPESSYETVPWPSELSWSAILRGAALQAGLDPRASLLGHLTRKVASGKLMSDAAAAHLLRSRTCTHIVRLLTEFGLTRSYADSVAERVYWWLASIHSFEQRYLTDAYWPNRAQWLGIDRAAAARVDLDGRYTLSTNLACFVAHRTGARPDDAKRWVHNRIAAHAQELARELGYGVVVSAMLRTRIARWLESFDGV